MDTLQNSTRERLDTMESQPLKHYVHQSLETYFAHLDGQTPSNLYNLFMVEVEIPLIKYVLQYVGNNQCKAARMLGISRSTLRKKMKEYNLES
jgi:Fis family transcriptional regulator, factor for inversion stimulation protein